MSLRSCRLSARLPARRLCLAIQLTLELLRSVLCFLCLLAAKQVLDQHVVLHSHEGDGVADAGTHTHGHMLRPPAGGERGPIC